MSSCSDIISWETRFLRIQSADKQNLSSSNTDFTVAFGNDASTQFQNRVYGISVQSVSFPNFIPNVPLNSQLTFTTFGGPAGVADGLHTIQIPGGNVDIARLVAQLNQMFNTPNLFDITWAIRVPMAQGNNLFSLQFSFGPTWTNPAGTLTINASPLTFYIGAVIDPLTNLSQTWSPAAPAPQALFRTNLYGLPIVFVHSTSLTAGRLGLVGMPSLPSMQQPGASLTAIAAVNISVPYGFLQQYEDNPSVQRPSTVYGGAYNLDISNVDISLRDQHGILVDLGLGEMIVVLRLWLRNI